MKAFAYLVLSFLWFGCSMVTGESRLQKYNLKESDIGPLAVVIPDLLDEFAKDAHIVVNLDTKGISKLAYLASLREKKSLSEFEEIDLEFFEKSRGVRLLHDHKNLPLLWIGGVEKIDDSYRVEIVVYRDAKSVDFCEYIVFPTKVSGQQGFKIRSKDCSSA